LEAITLKQYGNPFLMLHRQSIWDWGNN